MGGPLRLIDLPVGSTARVVGISAEHADRLIAHGLHVGSLVFVEGDGPFRGPRIVRVGNARIAVARSVGGAVVVEPVATDHRDGERLTA
jgi:Fe2+ transport system protein FeoA